MDPLMLETLMKLASAGTSGVCILAIFWSGYSLQRMPPGAPVERHRSLRHFMTVALAVAIVSASAASVNAYFNYHQNLELKGQNKHLAEAKNTLEGEFTTLAAWAEDLEISKNQVVENFAKTKADYTALKQEHEAVLRGLEIQPPPWDNEETREPGSQ